MEEHEILQALRAMMADTSLITTSSYAANAEVWPHNRIPFVDKHLAYLRSHPAVNPRHYLSNLRLLISK